MNPDQVTYGAFLLSHPFFWAFLAGGTLGASVASATRRPRGRRVRRAQSRKWTAAFLWATVAVASATCGILLADGLLFLSLPSLWVGLGSFAFFLLALRFPRAGGIPAFAVLAILAFAGPMTVRPFVSARADARVAGVRLLADTPSGATIEITDLKSATMQSPRVARLGDSTVTARVHRLLISDYLFFLGAPAAYVLEEVVSPDAPPADNPAAGQSPYAATPLLGRAVSAVPLLSLSVVESAPVTLSLLRPYLVVGSGDGSVTVEQEDGSE